MEHYNTIDGLLAPVRSGSLAPLSGRFLLQLAEGGGHLQRRQDLPADAFFVPSDEDLARVNERYRKGFFIALSYRWLTKGHPDPEGFHLGIVTAALKDHLRILGPFGISDVGVFWDFGSLYQATRVGNQEVLFKEGLRASNRWYGSVQSVVWLQSHLPPGFEGAPYDRSGWCFVEASISSVIKEAYCRYDLGLLEIGDFSKGEPIDWDKLQSGRLPPLSPARVAQKLADEKEFTNRSDVKKVVKLYASFFETVSSSIVELSFAECGWTAEHVGGFTEALPFFTSLKKLYLSGNKLSDEGATTLACALKANDTITELILYQNKIGDEGAMAFAESLKANNSITEMDLSLNNIGVGGAIALAESLKANNTITAIKLHRNNIGDGGALALAESLKANNSITWMILSNNKIGDGGAIALAEGLKANTTITAINLHCNNIGEGGALALAESLKANDTITKLYLYRNEIGDEGAMALAESLKANNSITEISLWSNKIGDGGAIALAESLKANNSITEISLSFNNIGDGGAIALAESLKANDTITKLDLDENKIGDEGAMAFAESLKANNSITWMDLSNNKIGDGGAIALAEGLKENTALKYLFLTDNNIGEEEKEALRNAQKVRGYINIFF